MQIIKLSKTNWDSFPKGFGFLLSDNQPILLEQERIKDAIRDRELDKNRLLFFSIRDLAIAAQAGISSGFDYMWNKYIIGAREAKNELDAIWLSIRNAVLKAIADIVQAEITKIFLKIPYFYYEYSYSLVKVFFKISEMTLVILIYYQLYK